MSLFGKILALFNIFGAIGLIVLAATSYGKRQEWAYSVLRHELVLTGLPLSEKELDAQGRPKVEQLSPKTLAEVVAGDQPVETQLKEADRLKDKFTADLQAITGADALPKQTYFLARVMLPLADSYLEREELLACRHYFVSADALAALKRRYQAAWDEAKKRSAEVIIPGKDPMSFEEAMHVAMRAQRGEASDALTAVFVKPDGLKDMKFDAAWDAALAEQLKSLTERLSEKFARADRGPESPAPADAKKVIDQKRAVARLLFGLCPALAVEREADFKGVDPTTTAATQRLLDSGEYRKALNRVYAVCGLRSAMAAIRDEADQLRQHTADAIRSQSQDLSTFVSDNTAMIEELRDRAEILRVEIERVADGKAKVAAQEVLVKSREKDVRDLRGELDKSRSLTKARVDDLRKASEEVREQRLEARDAIRNVKEALGRIVEKEALIRSRERQATSQDK